MYTSQELSFILYNNRSVKGVINNFLPKLNPYILSKLESNLEKSKSKFISDDRMVEVNQSELDITASDIVVELDELKSLTKIIRENIGNFNEIEYEYLQNRGIGEETIKKWFILGLSSIEEKRHLEILGATCHPILKKILQDGIENGGIIIPLFEKGQLANCAIRKINSSKSLKYTLACPDIPVWGLDKLKLGQEVWITEGLFDMMAIEKMGKNAVSCSSAMWSGIQLYSVIEKKPTFINIFSDNDEVGIRTSAILQDFFQRYGIDTKIWISNCAKDPAEHYYQKERNLSELEEVKDIEKLLSNKFDNSFDFLKHLKNRKY